VNAMLWKVCSFAILLLLVIPFMKSRRQRYSFVILSLVILAIAALAFLLTQPQGPLVNLMGFCGLIFVFWIASRFEAK
jgi:hypothetical protein